MTENDKIERSQDESGSDISLALELVGVGSYNSAALILERYIEEHGEDEHSAFVHLALLFRSRYIENYISKSDAMVDPSEDLRVESVLSHGQDVFRFANALTGDERAFFVREFLDKYITRLLQNKKSDSAQALAFLLDMEELLGEMTLSFMTLHANVFGEYFPSLLDSERTSALYQKIISRLYQVNKQAYAREEVARAKMYLLRGEFDEVTVSCENALAHLDTTYECHFLLLCA